MASFVDAAYLILKETGRPMSADEIMGVALKRGLVSSQGLTPGRTLGSQIYVDIRDNGPRSRFIKIERGTFALNGKSTDTPLATMKVASRPSAIASKREHTPKTARHRKHRDQVAPIDSSHLPGPQHLILDREVDAIHDFLRGRSDYRPSDERLCDWVQFCYTFELFAEGRDLFALVNPVDVQPWHFESTKKLARICTLKAGSHA